MNETIEAEVGEAKVAPKFRPIEDRLLVRVDQAEKVTAGGIILPDQAVKKMHRGVILAVGDDIPQVEYPGGVWAGVVKVGDKVLYGSYAGASVPGYDSLLVLKVDDILLVEE